MSYLGRLLGVEVAAQMALCACAVLLSAVVLAVALSDGGGTSDSAFAVLGGGGAIAIAAYLYSVGPVVVVIAPIYALPEGRGRCNLVTAADDSVGPGVA